MVTSKSSIVLSFQTKRKSTKTLNSQLFIVTSSPTDLVISRYFVFHPDVFHSRRSLSVCYTMYVFRNTFVYPYNKQSAKSESCPQFYSSVLTTFPGTLNHFLDDVISSHRRSSVNFPVKNSPFRDNFISRISMFLHHFPFPHWQFLVSNLFLASLQLFSYYYYFFQF